MCSKQDVLFYHLLAMLLVNVVKNAKVANVT